MPQGTTSKGKKTSPAARSLVVSHRLKQKPPVILVNIGTDIIGRGDSSGRIGIGQALARMTGGKYLFASDATLKEQFPAPAGKNPIAHHAHGHMAAFLKPHGRVDYVLGNRINNDLMSPHCQTYDSYNESLSSDLLDDENLVAHNLTRGALAQGAANFKKHYPEVKGTVLGVLMANPTIDRHFCRHLASIAASYPEATIVLCGCNRTDSAVMRETTKNIKHFLKCGAKNPDSVQVISYEYKENDPKNPYRGLIASADHLIVLGSSQSLISEALVRDRAAFVSQAGLSIALQTRGLTISFENCAHSQPLPVHPIRPVNVTRDIARAMIKRRAKHTAGALTARTQHMDNGARHFLMQIAIDPCAITTVPDRYRRSPAFVKAAIAVNPLVIEHVSPALRRDPKIMAAAILRNPDCLAFISPYLLRDRAFITGLMTAPSRAHVKRIYEHMHPTLQQDTALSILACRGNIAVEKSMSPEWLETLYDNEEYVLAAARQNTAAYSRASEKVKNTPGFKDRAVAINPRIYTVMTLDEQRDPARARAYFAHPFSYLPDAHDEISDDETIVRIALEAHSENAQHMSSRLKNDPAFFLSLKKIHPAIIRAAGHAIHDNSAVMMRAADEHANESYYHASKRLRHDVNFVLHVIQKRKEQGLNLMDDIHPDLKKRPDFVVGALRITKAPFFIPQSTITYYQDNETVLKDLADQLAQATDIDIKTVPFELLTCLYTHTRTLNGQNNTASCRSVFSKPFPAPTL